MEPTGVFNNAKIIDMHTRQQAIEDGVLIDMMQEEFREISCQHYKYPIAITAAVFAIMEAAANNLRHCNDFKGIWHDMLNMSRMCGYAVNDTTRLFPVIIKGGGRKSKYIFKLVCGPGDNAEPVLTMMMPDED